MIPSKLRPINQRIKQSNNQYIFDVIECYIVSYNDVFVVCYNDERLNQVNENQILRFAKQNANNYLVRDEKTRERTGYFACFRSSANLVALHKL